MPFLSLFTPAINYIHALLLVIGATIALTHTLQDRNTTE